MISRRTGQPDCLPRIDIGTGHAISANQTEQQFNQFERRRLVRVPPAIARDSPACDVRNGQEGHHKSGTLLGRPLGTTTT